MVDADHFYRNCSESQDIGRHEIERGTTRQCEPGSHWRENLVPRQFDVGPAGKPDRFWNIQSMNDLLLADFKDGFHDFREKERRALTRVPIIFDHRAKLPAASACPERGIYYVGNILPISRMSQGALKL